MSNKDLLFREMHKMLFPRDLGVAFLDELASRAPEDLVSYIPKIHPRSYKLLLTLYMRYLRDAT